MLKVEATESVSSSSSSDSAQELEALFAWSRARYAFEQQKNEVIEQMAVINEKLDSFAETHPTIAKYSDKIIEGLGTAAMGLALFAGPEITAATVLANGATLLTYGKLFEVLIEGGSEKFVDYCALQGRTESEAERYGTAAAGIVSKLLKLAVFRSGLKVVGGKKSDTVQVMNRAKASARAKEVFQAKAVNENTIRTEVNRGIFDAVNKAPYNPRAMETLLQSRYDVEISSSTMPKVNARNVKFSGDKHNVTGIVFNERGMPIFDDIAKIEVKLPKNIASIKNRKVHFIEATKQLHKLINEGIIDRKQFNSKQLAAILDDLENIPGYTWHHHENMGRMQLVSREIHQKTGHVGGFDLWFR